jgi:FAD/FMN-containing dehydrogenase
VLGIEAVLPNGEIYSGLKNLIKDNAGYNLGRLLVGAEGTLGIITAATLKLFPELNQKITAVVAVETTEKALALLHHFQSQASEYLTAFEVMSREALKLVTQKIVGTRFPGDDDAPLYVLVEMGVTSPSLPLRAVMEECAAAALESGLIVDAVMAESDTQAGQFWHLREHIPEAVRKTGNSIHFDISLPTTAWADFMADMGSRIRTIAPDILLVPFGHLGDGNLHYNMCFEKTPDHFADLKKKIKEMVYADIIKLKGSISAEHGIGLERKEELKQAREPHELALMKRIKLAFDPHNLMNPGKIFD